MADVYIEYIGLHVLKSGTAGSSIENINLFGLRIDELPNVGTANADLLGYYLFPNETYGKNDNAADAPGAEGDAAQSTRVDATTYTVKLKSNYLTTVTSGSYRKLTLSLLGLTYNAGDNYDFVQGAQQVQEL